MVDRALPPHPVPPPPAAPAGRSTPRARRHPIAACLLAALTAAAAACAPEPPPAAAAPAPPVEVVRVRSGALPEVVRLDGVVRAADQIEVRAEIAAPIAEVLVGSGDTVAAGQLLVRLRADELRQRLRQAEAVVSVEEAAARAAAARASELRAEVSRLAVLAQSGLTSPLERETGEAQLQAAEANAAAAAARVTEAQATRDEQRAALARAEVRAPAAGRIGQVLARVGALADPGSLLFVLGNPDRLLVDVRLTESQLARARPGQPVTLRRDRGGEPPLAATLSRLSPFLSPGSFSAAGEIELPPAAAGWLPGMFAIVDLETGVGEEAALVPVSVLAEDEATGELVAWVLRPPVQLAEPAAGDPVGEVRSEALAVERRTVRLLAEGRGVAGVEGLAAGEWAVAVGQHLLAQDDRSLARVRSASWERMLELQALQSEDVLARFLEKQRRLAREPRTPSAGQPNLGGDGAAAAPTTPSSESPGAHSPAAAPAGGR